jgi:hypothetical protein
MQLSDELGKRKQLFGRGVQHVMSKVTVARALMVAAVGTSVCAMLLVTQRRFPSKYEGGALDVGVAILETVFESKLGSGSVAVFAAAGITSFAAMFVAAAKPRQPLLKRAAMVLALGHLAIWLLAALVFVGMMGLGHPQM